MNIRKMNERGFTLIEVIAVLVLVGITAAMAGMWIVSVANGYIITQMNMDTTQKAQLAMTRLTKELTAIKTVDTGATTATQITYTRKNYDYIAKTDLGDIQKTINYDAGSGTLTMNGNILADNVNAFTLAYCDNVASSSCPSAWSPTSHIVQVTLKLNGADNTVAIFSQRIAPRNL